MTYATAGLISYLSISYLLANLSELLSHSLGSPKCVVKFKIVPNRHQATDFLSNKDIIIQTNKVWYERDWFWGGVSCYKYERPVFLAQMLFYKCSDL